MKTKMPKKLPEAQIVGVAENGEVVKDLSVLEETGTAFDPTKATLDLTKEEKRRTTALLMAIQAYNNIIIKDAEMYLAISRDKARDGSIIQPATMSAMVEAAIQFDAFIAGYYSLPEGRRHPTEPEKTVDPEPETPAADVSQLVEK